MLIEENSNFINQFDNRPILTFSNCAIKLTEQFGRQFIFPAKAIRLSHKQQKFPFAQKRRLRQIIDLNPGSRLSQSWILFQLRKLNSHVTAFSAYPEIAPPGLTNQLQEGKKHICQTVLAHHVSGSKWILFCPNRGTKYESFIGLFVTACARLSIERVFRGEPRA